MEPASGIEPPTNDLRNRCSTTELRRLKAGNEKQENFKQSTYNAKSTAAVVIYTFRHLVSSTKVA